MLPALAKIFRTSAEALIKNAGEITGIPESDLKGDLGNTQIGLH